MTLKPQHSYLDDEVGHIHLLTDGGQPHDELDGVHVVRDDHQAGLAALDQVRHVVQPKLDHHRLLLVRRLARRARLRLRAHRVRSGSINTLTQHRRGDFLLRSFHAEACLWTPQHPWGDVENAICCKVRQMGGQRSMCAG